MKVKLLRKSIIAGIPTEEQLSDLVILEGTYVIRTLKALVKSLDEGSIEVSEEIENGQVFSKEFDIWFQKDEYQKC